MTTVPRVRRSRFPRGGCRPFTGWSRWCRVRLEGFSRLVLVPPGVLLCGRPVFCFCFFVFFGFFFFFLEGVPEPPLPVESRSSTPRASRVQHFLFFFFFLALERVFFPCVAVLATFSRALFRSSRSYSRPVRVRKLSRPLFPMHGVSRSRWIDVVLPRSLRAGA